MESNQNVEPRPWPFRITHMGLCVHISIRIGYRQHKNIHFLQNGGDSWILLVISHNLSGDNTLVSDITAGWVCRSIQVSP